MTTYHVVSVDLVYDGTAVLATGTIEKKDNTDWMIVQEFSTYANPDEDIAVQVLLVIKDVIKRDYTINQVLPKAKKIIEAKTFEIN